MGSEKELFERVLGADEPPLKLDVTAVERAGRRSLRRRRWIAPAAIAVVTAAGLTVAVLGLRSENDHGLEAAAAPSVPAALTPSSEAPDPPRYAVPTTRTMAYCYRTADITTTEIRQHVLIGISGNDPDGRGDVAARAMPICTQAWEQGYWGWQPPVTDGRPHTAPALVGCILTDAAVKAQEGALAVMPGDESTCTRLGLPIAKQ